MTPQPAPYPSRPTWRLAAFLLLAALALASAPAQAQAPPATPSSVTLMRADGTLTASWQAVTGATSYHVTYTSNNGTSWSLAALHHTEASITISPVDNAKTYVVGVRARNDHGDSIWRNSPAAGPFTPTPPATPTRLTATAGYQSVTLAWTDPSDATITGYEYQVNHNDTLTGKFSGWGPWQSISGSGAATTSHVISGLVNGREYRYHVRAVNAIGASGSAPDALPFYVVAIPLDPPAAPTGLTTIAGYKRAAIIWNDPSDSSITGYEYAVQQAGKDPGKWFTIRGSDAGTTFRIIRNLTTGTAYVIHLRAVNAGGAGAAAQAGVTPKIPLIITQDSNGNAITELSIPEGGEVSYQVKLDSRPLTDTTMHVGLVNLEYYNNIDPDITFKGQGSDVISITLFFTPENWDTAQTVTLVAAEDNDDVNGMRDVSHRARESEYSPDTNMLTVTEIDNDQPGIVLQDGNGNAITELSIPEGGEASYQVKPSTRPPASLDIDVTLTDGTHNDPDVTFKGQGSNVTEITLTFTPENWETAQTVTLVAAEDADDVNGVRDVNHATRNTHTTKLVVLTVTEIDNEQPVVTAVRGNDGDSATVSWTAYEGDGFEYYRVIVCDDSQYNGQSCNGTVFKSPAIWGADSTGPVTVTGLDASTGYGVILQVWRNGSALKVHATLPAPAAGGSWSVASAAEAAGIGSAGGGAQRQGRENLDSRPRSKPAPDLIRGRGQAFRGSDGISTPAPLPTGHVTNLASARSGDSDVDAGQRQAVAFTTGPNPGGYVLNSFTAALRKVSGDADLVLTLHATASDGQPAATILATLAGADPTSGAYTDVTYTCSGSGCRLAAGTTYFVVAESIGSGAYAWAYVASANLYTETTEPAGSGWTLGAGHYTDDNGDWTSWDDWHHARIDFAAPQSPVVTVGNLDRAVHDDACFPSGDVKCAVAFTTGPNPDGYTLAAVTARFAAAADPDGLLGDLVATLHADSSGIPGALLATLSGSNPRAAGDYTYTCSGLESCVLSPNTTYFVQFTATAGEVLSEAYEWASTLSDHETQSPAGNGWTLADGTDGYGSSWSEYRDVGLLRVRATAR